MFIEGTQCVGCLTYRDSMVCKNEKDLRGYYRVTEQMAHGGKGLGTVTVVEVADHSDQRVLSSGPTMSESHPLARYTTNSNWTKAFSTVSLLVDNLKFT